LQKGSKEETAGDLTVNTKVCRQKRVIWEAPRGKLERKKKEDAAHRPEKPEKEV